MNFPETVPKTIPSWLADMEFCHVTPPDSEKPYCGWTVITGVCPGGYKGEAICTSCGYPTCPRCAQLEALDMVLEEQ